MNKMGLIDENTIKYNLVNLHNLVFEVSRSSVEIFE